MIASLRGNVIKISETEIVIETNGVGYKIICSQRVISNVKQNSGVCFVFTEFVVREASLTLYGFLTETERELFNLLTSVQGIGGRSAIAILSTLTDDELIYALANDDKQMLCRANGIGEKAAVKIIAELKSKIGKILNKTICTGERLGTVSHVMLDVKSALANLGYAQPDINNVISSIELHDGYSFDTLLKLALKKISESKK